MSTRAMIRFGRKYNGKLHAEASIYRHSDGYPDTTCGVLADLARFFFAVERDTADTRFDDPEHLAAKFVVWEVADKREQELNHAAEMSRTRPAKDGPLNFLGVCVALHMSRHSDLEWVYFVDCSRHDAAGRPRILVRHADSAKYKSAPKFLADARAAAE